MKLTIWAAPALAFTMLLSGVAIKAQTYEPQPPRPPSYGPVEPWEATPPEYRPAMQRGFHDGVEGARRDLANHRTPDVNNRDEYRNPVSVRRADRRDYRVGFQRGYNNAVRHIYSGGPGYFPR